MPPIPTTPAVLDPEAERERASAEPRFARLPDVSVPGVDDETLARMEDLYGLPLDPFSERMSRRHPERLAQDSALVERVVDLDSPTLMRTDAAPSGPHSLSGEGEAGSGEGAFPDNGRGHASNSLEEKEKFGKLQNERPNPRLESHGLKVVHPPHSQARREAARKNGKLSHGPATGKGKEKALANLTGPKTEEGREKGNENLTGPATPEGKEAASANATKHGIFARMIFPPGMLARHALVRWGLGEENAAEYNALLQHLHQEFEPRGAMERLLVEKLATLFWRYRRVMRYECGEIEENVRGLEATLTEEDKREGHANALVASKLMRCSLPPAEAQERALRYETAVERAFYRCYALLERRKSRVWREDTPPMRAVFHIG